jgi:hypothetical protein
MALFSHTLPPADKIPTEIGLAHQDFVNALHLSGGLIDAARDLLSYRPWTSLQSNRDAQWLLCGLFATALTRVNPDTTVAELCDLLSEQAKREVVRKAILVANDKASQQ